jgi:hypothetical protein
VVVVLLLLDTWHVLMERFDLGGETLAHEREALEGPTTFISNSNDLQKCQNVTLKRVTSCFFRVSYVHFRVKFEFYIVKGKSKGCCPLTLWFTLKLSGQTLVVGFV